MDSSVSSIVNRLGAGSGIDMVQLAGDLAQVRFAAQTQQLETRNESLQARISAASSLRNQLSQLSAALGERIRTGDLAPAPAIGNGSVATPSVAPGASPGGTYLLEVTQLAQGQTLASRAFGAGTDPAGEGTLTVRFGAAGNGSFTPDDTRSPIQIEVGADDTLNTLAGKINAANGGITAYVAIGTSGAQLVLKGADGTQHGFVIETQNAAPSSGSAPGDLDYLAWNPANDTGQLRQRAQNAQFTLDTIAMTSATNAVRGLPEGLRLDLTGTNSGAPTTISFADRSRQIGSMMNDFVNALNDISVQLQQNAAPRGGELGNDSGARALKRALAGLTGTAILRNPAPGAPNTLGDLGLSFNRDGSFRIDNARLSATLAASPQGAAALFTTGPFGVFATVDDLARGMASAGDPGSLAGSIARYTGQIARNDDRLNGFAEQEAVLRERMVKQFAAADRIIAQSNSTRNFIQSQIAIWNADSN